MASTLKALGVPQANCRRPRKRSRSAGRVGGLRRDCMASVAIRRLDPRRNHRDAQRRPAPRAARRRRRSRSARRVRRVRRDYRGRNRCPGSNMCSVRVTAEYPRRDEGVIRVDPASQGGRDRGGWPISRPKNSSWSKADTILSHDSYLCFSTSDRCH